MEMGILLMKRDYSDSGWNSSFTNSGLIFQFYLISKIDSSGQNEFDCYDCFNRKKFFIILIPEGIQIVISKWSLKSFEFYSLEWKTLIHDSKDARQTKNDANGWEKKKIASLRFIFNCSWIMFFNKKN